MLELYVAWLERQSVQELNEHKDDAEPLMTVEELRSMYAQDVSLASDEPRCRYCGKQHEMESGYCPLPASDEPRTYDAAAGMRAELESADEPRERVEPRDEALYNLVEDVLAQSKHDAEQVPCIRCGKRGHVVSQCGEPRKDNIELPAELRRGLAAWKLVAPFITPDNAPILAAVLTEVARIEREGEYYVDPSDWHGIAIRKAALAICEALRLSKEGA